MCNNVVWSQCTFLQSRSVTLVSGNVIISTYTKAFLILLSSNRSRVVKIDAFAVFPKLYLRRLGNNIDIVVAIRSRFVVHSY